MQHLTAPSLTKFHAVICIFTAICEYFAKYSWFFDVKGAVWLCMFSLFYFFIRSYYILDYILGQIRLYSKPQALFLFFCTWWLLSFFSFCILCTFIEKRTSQKTIFLLMTLCPLWWIHGMWLKWFMECDLKS